MLLPEDLVETLDRHERQVQDESMEADFNEAYEAAVGDNRVPNSGIAPHGLLAHLDYEWQESGNAIARQDVARIYSLEHAWNERNTALLLTVVRASAEGNPIAPFLARLALKPHNDIDE